MLQSEVHATAYELLEGVLQLLEGLLQLCCSCWRACLC